MATINVPIREVQSPGMLTDSPPSSLPASAWSYARNMMFSAKGASRAPHFLLLSSTSTMPEVYHIAGQRYSNEGFDDTYVLGPLVRVTVRRLINQNCSNDTSYRAAPPRHPQGVKGP